MNKHTAIASIALNARYQVRSRTGVETYASQIAARLGESVAHLQPRQALPQPMGYLWEQIRLPGLLGDRVLWSPANTGPVAVRQQAVTVHDISPIEHPEWYRPAFAAWYRLLWPKLLKRVSHVITDSEFSRGRIMNRYGLSSEKMTVVSAGVDHDVFYPAGSGSIEQFRVEHQFDRPYILFVGSLQPRKNLPGLLLVWRQLREDFPEHELIIAGEGGPAFARFDLPEVPSVRLLGRVPGEDLPALYNGADLFVNPSYYEGAGLTVLEAMACGCPVAAAGNTAIPEYTGEAALLFDPYDIREMREAIRLGLTDTHRRKSLRAAGIQRARAFSWVRSAGEVRKVLESISLRLSL